MSFRIWQDNATLTKEKLKAADYNQHPIESNARDFFQAQEGRIMSENLHPKCQSNDAHFPLREACRARYPSPSLLFTQNLDSISEF